MMPTPSESTSPQFIRLEEVERRIGLKKTAIYERVKAGEFPSPRRLGARRSVWLESEVTAWMLNQM